MTSLKDIIQLNLNREGIFFLSASFGNPFNIENTNNYYIPVIIDNEIVTFVRYYNDGNSFNLSVGKYFADTINALDDSERYSIVGDEFNNVFAVDSKNQIYEIHTSIITPPSDEFISNIKFKFEDHDIDYVDILEPIQEINYPRSTRAQGTGRWLYNYPWVANEKWGNDPQKNGLCWAASMAMIMRGRKGPSNITASQIASNVNHPTNSGGSITQVINYFGRYGYSASQQAAPSFSVYKTEIDNGRAVWQYINGRYSTSPEHAIVIIGYCNDTDPSKYGWVTVRDPNFSSPVDNAMVSSNQFYHDGIYKSENIIKVN